MSNDEDTRDELTEKTTDGENLRVDDHSTKNVLVVGDWVVDENWTVATHQSPTSTEPIGSHFRSIVTRNGAVFGFCGAGRVARVLYWMNRYAENSVALNSPSGPRLNIYGIGVWANEDSNNLRLLFKPESSVNNNPYQLFSSIFHEQGQSELEGVKLINLAPIFVTNQEEPFCTTRIYRVFRTLQDGGLDMVQRIDWELPAAKFNDKYREWSIKDESSFVSLIKDNLGKQTITIDAIVVKCLGKGVVSGKLVTNLREQFPNADWFVSSKLGTPQWLENIKDKRLKLLFLPPIPMASMEEVPEWFMGNGMISQEAEKYIKNLIEKYPCPAVVIMPRGLSIIGLYSDAKQRYLYTHFSAQYDRYTERIGKASIFFASLVANMLFENPEFGTIIRRSLNKTLQWRKNEEHRLSGGKLAITETAYNPDLLKGGNELETQWPTEYFPWEDHEKRWDKSRKGLGIVDQDSDKPKFELWRGMSVVDGYIAIVETRRKAVLKLYNLARSFISPRFTPRHHRSSVSCLLVDSPGRGKTALMRSLAETLNINFLSFNITEMVTREDIINSFDVIVTTQARERGKPIIVFVDEIDTYLSNGPVFDLFLAPLDDGVYVRGGNRFRIDPCIWIFAGTKELKAKSNMNNGVSGTLNKASDFVSRLTNGQIILTDLTPERVPQSHKLDHLHRLERVYIGVNMLRTRYRDLRYVTAGVLLWFYRLNPKVSTRKIRHFVENIHDVEYATVSQRNLPLRADIIEEGELDKSHELKGLGYEFNENTIIEVPEPEKVDYGVKA